MTTFVHSFCSRHVLCIDAKDYETIGDLKAYLSETKGFPLTACFFVCDGKIVEDDEPVLQGFVYHTFPRILGGKGGFGSMLRAIGAQIEKTTNREALRDLSGRRMRDVNNEKALKEWISKQADKEKERDEKRQERIARRRAMPNHKFDDPEYDKQKSRLAENQEDALQEGLKKALPGTSASATMTYEESLGGKSAVKRKCEMAGPSSSKVRKATEWLGVDIDDMDIDSDDTSGGEDSQSGEDGAIDIPTAAAGNSDGVSTDSCDNCATTRMESPAAEGVTMVDPTVSSVADSDTRSAGNSSLQKPDHDPLIEKAGSIDSLGTSHESNVPSIHEEKCGMVASNTDENEVSIQQKMQTQVDTQNSTISIIKTEDVSVNSEDAVPVIEDCIKKEAAITETADTEKGGGNQESINSETVEQTNIKQEPFNLDSVGSITELLPLGLEGLKSELMCRGLKCGGTLEQRAERLFAVKGLKPEEIDASLFAKPSGGKQKKKKN